MDETRRSAKVSESRMVFNHRFLPDKLNPFGVVHGGHIMALMDHVTGITGYRFARKRIVTASVEHMSLHAPVHAGRLLICYTSVNRVWGSSMEIGVRGVEEDFLTGEQVHALTCYMTFVGLDDDGKPCPLPQVVPETDEDRRRMADAARRMAASVMERKTGFARTEALELDLDANIYSLCRLPLHASPAECMARILSVQAGEQTDEAFLAVMRDRDAYTFILREEAARELEATCPEIEADPGFCCLRMAGPDALQLSRPISGITSLLAASGIRGLCVSTPVSDCLLLRTKCRAQVLNILQGAGYAVQLPGT